MKRNSKHLSCLTTALITFFTLGSASAQTANSLIDKLVEKGILSVKEGAQLREEAERDSKSTLKTKSTFSDSATSLKFNGDFRGRYDGVFQDDQNYGPKAPPTANTYAEKDRTRFRYRLRFGVTASLYDNFEVGLRLGSGEQSAAAPGFGSKHKLSLTSGQFVIAENFSPSGAGNNNDAYLFINQLDWTATWTKAFSSRLALGLMNFAHQRDISPALEPFLNQNGIPAVGIGSQNFNPVIGRAEATYNLDSFPMFTGKFPITVIAEYVNNPAADDQPFPGKTYRGKANEGYNFGLQLGSNKAKHNWQLLYNYKNIETAALWHGLNDDDFGFNAKGGTDVRGHQMIASYHLFEPMLVNIRYSITEQINNVAHAQAEQQRIFLDLLWLF